MPHTEPTIVLEDAATRAITEEIRRASVADEARESSLVEAFLRGEDPLVADALPSPDEYMRKTALGMFKPRGKETKAVDEAYPAFQRAYVAARGDASNASLVTSAMILLERLDALVAAKGDWSQVDRNTASNGLLQHLHGLALGIAGERMNAQRRREVLALRKDMVHARFGVMYLLGNVTIGVDWAPVVLGGLADVGGAAAMAGVAGGTGSFGAATQHSIANTLSPSAVTTVGQTVGRAAAGAAASASSMTRRIEDHNAERRIHADWAPEATFPLTRAAFDALTVPTDDAIVSRAVSTYRGSALVGAAILDTAHLGLRAIIQPLYKIVVELINKVREACFKDDLFAARMGGAVVKAIASQAIEHICKAAVPFVGGGSKIFTGICQVALAVKERTALYLDRRIVRLTSGHFELIGNAIESQVTRGMFLGLWSSLKGAADIAANAFLPGCGPLASAILTALEWVVRFTARLFEQSAIGGFLEVAAQRWQVEQTGAKRIVDRENPGITRYEAGSESYAHRPGPFKSFFKKGCDASVLIPMLTLNSGICGSITEQIEMFSDGRMITQREFDAGVAYFARLKRISSRYMRASGFKFTGRNGLDKIVAFAVRDHGGHGMTDKVMTALAT